MCSLDTTCLLANVGDTSPNTLGAFCESPGKAYEAFHATQTILLVVAQYRTVMAGAITPLPSAAQVACQFPKPILLNTGYAHIPYDWAPSTVDVQMLRVGNFVMLIMPGELTTMTGRRMRFCSLK
ncbi:hypothetical protein H2248_004011 [Termitomyces sp. 'cryptogamus']|nr:hypothetical protein H2248_004011 [Termitomyces sp. 'cryptogamus']